MGLKRRPGGDTSPDSNDLQARWLIEQHIIDPPLISAALDRLKAQPDTDTDLCDSLIRQGLLDERTASQARSAAKITARRPPSDPRQDARDRLPMPRTGQLFADFLLKEELGRGGMGRVYRARKKNHPDDIALKIIASSPDQPQTTARFLREVNALIKLDHPNIIKIIDAGQHNGLLYLAMERIQGLPLSKLLEHANKQRGGIPFQELRLPLLDITHALAYAHTRGILHRDIKPDNIILEDETHRPVLIDFGLTKATPQQRPAQSIEDLTQSGTIAGTPAYMAPEQIPGSQSGPITEKTDIWSLGATIFALCSGVPPFQRPTILATLNAITEARTPELRSLKPDTPSWLNKLLRQCLDKNPRHRPSTQQISRALQLQKAPRNPKRALLALLITSLLALTTPLILPVLAPKNPTLLASQPPDHSFTSQKTIQITGLLDQPNTPILINQQPTTTDQHGRFYASLSLNRGRNTILLKTSNKNQTQIAQLLITRDDTPPRIILDGLQDNTLLADTLKGRIIEQHLRSLTINEQTITTDQSGRFSHQTNTANTLLITATDDAGNSQTRTVRRLSPEQRQRRLKSRELQQLTERLQAQQTRLQQATQQHKLEATTRLSQILDNSNTRPAQHPTGLVLANIHTWNESTKENQDRAIRLAIEVLAPHFSFARTINTTDGHNPTRIAILHEQETGLELALLPGAIIEDTRWSSPNAQSQIALLEELGHPLSSLRFLQHVLAYTWYEGLAAACADLLLAKQIPPKPTHTHLLDALKKYRTLLAKQDPNKARDPQIPEAESQLGLRLVELLEAHLDQWPPLKKRLLGMAKRYRGRAPRVTTSRYLPPYLVGLTEVPFSVWQRLGGAVPPREQGSDMSLPARRLTAAAIEDWLRARPAGLRLLTFDEWREAAGARDPFPWGPDRARAVLEARTIERAQRQPRPASSSSQAFSIKDLLGNIEEWVDPDWQRWRRAWATDPAANEQVNSQQNRAMFLTRRLAVGGAFYYPRELASTRIPRYQQRDDADLRSFRIARGLFD